MYLFFAQYVLLFLEQLAYLPLLVHELSLLLHQLDLAHVVAASATNHHRRRQLAMCHRQRH